MEDYRGGWRIVGAIRDAARGPTGLTALGDADAEEHGEMFPADILFTDLGLLVFLKERELRREDFLALRTTLSPRESGTLAPEQVRQAHQSLLYDEIKEVRLTGGKPPGRFAAKIAGSEPITTAWVSKAGRLGSPVVLDFRARLPIEEVRGFLQQMPLAGKIRER